MRVRVRVRVRVSCAQPIQLTNCDISTDGEGWVVVDVMGRGGVRMGREGVVE